MKGWMTVKQYRATKQLITLHKAGGCHIARACLDNMENNLMYVDTEWPKVRGRTFKPCPTCFHPSKIQEPDMVYSKVMSKTVRRSAAEANTVSQNIEYIKPLRRPK